MSKVYVIESNQGLGILKVMTDKEMTDTCVFNLLVKGLPEDIVKNIEIRNSFPSDLRWFLDTSVPYIIIRETMGECTVFTLYKVISCETGWVRSVKEARAVPTTSLRVSQSVLDTQKPDVDAEFVKKVQDTLNQVKTVSGRQNKIRAYLGLFEYLSQPSTIKYIEYNAKPFKEKIRHKLCEFYYFDGWELAKHYYALIFETAMPPESVVDKSSWPIISARLVK